ncbi:MAG: hypothetical protein H7A09_02380 [Oceanospirillaceae bacterium]|nr:hypothetical protein [Oceanospirillaceae bacterium]MCP5334464.1 hypothetical protein [Oceanospirillaceae bacterium]MCP5350828.1 hypothetical protein [Oceanospirillaceae bacterium]
MAFEMDEISLQSMLDPISRYAQQKLAPLCQRHETPLSAHQQAQVWQDFAQLGLLPENEEGYAPWEHNDATGRSFSIHALQNIARASTAMALALHHHNLSQALRRELHWPLVQYSSLSLAGRYGLLGLFDAPAVARDNFSAHDGPLLRQHHSLFEGANILALLWQDGPVLCELRDYHSRSEHNHGFESQLLYSWSGGQELHCAPIPQQALQNLLSREWLGLCAIAAGTLQRALQLAEDYAALRRQGGQVIGHYPAVQSMLHSSASTLHHSRVLLDDVANSLNFNAACYLYSDTLPALRKAAQQCLQVFGGMGYMQDTGVEKTLREINHLMHITGNPAECRLLRRGVA